MTPPSDLTVLLRQAGWTRALARSLAADADLAEDLVQDAWVAALERPPDLRAPVRGWIASVLRHRWLDLLRARERRAQRERSAAADEAWPSSHDVVEKAALQRALVEAVLELDEPYRTTVLLRFFEELPQRAIAERMRTSTATVNSRLTRGLARLREKLSRGGGPASWLHVLVPLLGKPATAPALVLGAGAMKAIVTSFLVAASVVAGLALWLSRGVEPRAGERPLSSAAVPELVVAPSPAALEAERGRSERRTPLEPQALPPARPEPLPAAAVQAAVRTIRGRVLDAAGLPVAGVALALSRPGARGTCTSAAGGWFEIAVDGPGEAIVSADPRYATVLAGSAHVQGATRPTVVIAPRIDLAGVVVDESRARLADAALELRLPAGFGAEWGFALDYSLPQRWQARSAPDGRFDLGGVPAVAGSTLHAALAGFAPHEEQALLASTSALEVVLARPRESSGLVQGVVLDPAGERAHGARVSAGNEIALTDERGRFALDLRAGGSGERLVALKAGLLPAIFEPERDHAGLPLWPADVVLQLGGPARAVSGRVVDADGEPVAGARVWLDDPTPFGRADVRVVAEALLRGDERFWSFVTSGSDGAFTIDGLLPRAYRLQAVDPRTLVSVESAPVRAADSPLELRLPTRDVHERVAGRVVTASGRPIPGVSVRLSRITYELEHEDGTDNESQAGEPVLTGEDGAFEFRNVPRQGVDLYAAGDTILGAGAQLEQEADPGRIELVASLRLHLQVELDEPRERADRLVVFRADGRRVPLRVFRGQGSHASFEMPIVAGRSAVLAVEEDAATLALYRGAEEVARFPLHLAPGPTNLVRY